MSVEKKWLVKSSDSIQGPFEFDSVVESIFTGDIHLLDEIKGPFERWRPIKDHSLFAAAIEKLKATTYQQRENTVTATVELSKTHELTRSQTISVTNQNENTLTPTDKVGEDGGQEGTQVYQPQSSQPGPGPQPINNSMGYGQPNQSKRFPTVFFASFLLIVIGVATYLVYEFKQTRLIEQKISAYDQLTDVAIDSLKVGEYQKALKNFTMAYNISPQDANLLLEMAPLSIQFDGQFDQTQAMLENMLVSHHQKSIIRLARNIIGLSYSYRQQFAEALASYDQALEISADYFPAQLNKAFVLMKLGRYDQAVRLMKKVVIDNPDEPIAHYFYIRSLAEKGIASKDPAILKETLSVSDQYAQKFADFRQEVLFLIAIVHSQLEATPERMMKLIDNFMKVDLELTKLHVHDSHVDFQSFNWLDFFQYCNQLEQGLPDYNMKMLKGFCYLKVNRPLDAKRIFEELMSQKNNDGILQALYSSTLLSLKDVSQAKNALGFINQIDLKQPVVETILRGCLKAGDLACGEAIFRGKHAKYISLLYSHWGNSEIHFAKDRKKAKTSVVLGLQISPNFAPLLKLKRKFDK